MCKRKFEYWVVPLLLGVPCGALAQAIVPHGAIVAPQAPSMNFSDDLLTVNLQQPGIALRHGGVIDSTLVVLYDGVTLQEGSDFTLDAGNGVIYLSRPSMTGHTLEVRYRYDPAQATTGALNTGTTGFSLNLLPGQLNMTLGFGMIERNAQGGIERTNMLGWNNNFSMGGSALKGMMMLGSATSQQGVSNLEGTPVSNQAATPTDSHQSFVLETLSNKFLGGSLNFNYQDISKGFNAFSSLVGVDPATLQQLEREKGLKQTGFSLQGAKLGSLSLTDSQTTISDGNGKISLSDYGIKSGGFHFDVSSENVGKTFTRFDDLAETNHADLKTSAGLSKRDVIAGFDLNKGTFALTQNYISDPSGSIVKNDALLKLQNLSFDYGSQKVTKQFDGVNNLLAGEKADYGLDVGLNRNWLNFQYSPGKSGDVLKVSSLKIGDDKTAYSQFQTEFSSKGFSIVHERYDVSPTFSRLNALNVADTDANINETGLMYGPDVKVNAPAERGLYQSDVGITRDFTGVTFDPFKGVNVHAGQLNLAQSTGTANGNAGLGTFNVTIPKASFSYRHEQVGSDFTDLPSLMGFEKAQLGSLNGIDRSDLALNLTLGKKETLSASSFNTTSLTDFAKRLNFSFDGPTAQMSYISRSVSPGFATVNQLSDPEASMLATLVGKTQTNGLFHWAESKALQISASLQDAKNIAAETGTDQNGVSIAYATKSTQIGAQIRSIKNTDALIPLASHTDQQMYLDKSSGPWKVDLSQESDRYDPDQVATGVAIQPSFVKQTAGLDYKLDSRTSLSTLQSRTRLQNGQSESSSTNAVTTTVSKRAGITISDTEENLVDTTQHDESHRNYGFWYDLGHGVQFRYGYVRQLDTAGPNTLNSFVSLGTNTADPNVAQLNAVNQGTLGDVAIGGGYGVNQWQNEVGMTNGNLARTQSFSNVRLNSVKPFNSGIFKQNTFHFSLDTAADNFNWIRQDDNVGGTGVVEGLTWGLNFHSQKDPNAQTAIDRVLALSTDPKHHTFLEGSLMYKMRTLPQNQKDMIRSYKLTINPTKNLALSNVMISNPETPNALTLLGSVPQPLRQNLWTLTYAQNKQSDLGGSWEEIVNDSNHSSSVTAGINATLFKTSSPLSLFYGLQDTKGPDHQLSQRWSIGYLQKAGPNQSFNFFVGDLAYQYSLPVGQYEHNLSVRVDYQFHF